MPIQKLKRLKPQARRLVPTESYASAGSALVEKYIESAPRVIDVSPLLAILDAGINKYKDSPIDSSDGWFAPRVHAALRLFRSEAANLEYWEYLSICVPEVREYVLWRWGSSDGLPTRNRILGSDRRHALARLWWTAELTRNGPDYEPTVAAFDARSQDFVNYLTDTDAFHNRAAALAFIDYFSKRRKDQGMKAKQAVELAKALNHVLTTVVLDSLAPDDGGDMDAYSRWVGGHVDETLMIERLPEGPKEPLVPEDQIAAVGELLDSLQVGLTV